MLKYNLAQIDLISKKILPNLSKSDFLFLIGELGSGKTTFARNLINHLQKRNKVGRTEVPSPTFNLLYEYELKSSKIMHYDLYRIKTVEEVEQLGILEGTPNVLSIIEWPEKLKKKIKNRLEITFYHGLKPEIRKIKFKGFGRWKNFKLNEI